MKRRWMAVFIIIAMLLSPQFDLGAVHAQTSASGTVVAWGSNAYGQSSVPADLSGVTAIAAGQNHSLALKNDGTVVAWGSNTYGQISVPADLSGVTAIAAGISHSLALKSDGTVVGWGLNNWNQISVPAGLSGVTAIAAGQAHSLALKSDGTVVGWGHNEFGQSSVPAGLSGVIAIAAGTSHSMALKADGTVVAWGLNQFGQSSVPSDLSGVTAIVAGIYHSLALKNDGTVVAWGWNAYGQSSVPSDLSGVTAIAAGQNHSLALKNDGTVVGWGSNVYGQISVPSGLSGVTAIAAGTYHNLALASSAAPDLAITQVADEETVSTGDPIGFTITITNNGDATANIVTLTNPLPIYTELIWSIGGTDAAACVMTDGVVSCNFGDMPPGAVKTIRITAPEYESYSVCFSPIVTSIATLMAYNQPVNKTATASVTVLCPNAYIEVWSDSPGVTAGDPISFTTEFGNLGDGIARNVLAETTLPTNPGLSWSIMNIIPAEAANNCVFGNDSFGTYELICSFDQLPAGQVVTITLTSPTTSESCGMVESTGYLTLSNGSWSRSMMKAPYITCPVAVPDLAITQVADQATVSTGDPIGFTITVTNNGDAAANIVTLTDTLPIYPEFSWSIGGTDAAACTITDGVVSCNFQDINPGEVKTIRLTAPEYEYHSKCFSPIITSTATLMAYNQPVNKTATASVTVLCPYMFIDIYPDTIVVQPGDPVSYTVTIGNQGDGNAKDVDTFFDIQNAPGMSWAITDVTPDSAASNCTFGPDGTWMALECIFDQIAPLEEVSITLSSPTTSESCGVFSAGGVMSASNNFSIKTKRYYITVNCPVAVPDLAITQVADQETVSTGDPIGFTITVTNNGDAAANTVTLTDTLPIYTGLSWLVSGTDAASCTITAGVLSCNFGDIPPGAVKTIRLTSPGPTSSGKCDTPTISNTATVVAINHPEERSATASTSVLCPFAYMNGLANTPSVTAGDPVSLTVQVGNMGEGIARDVGIYVGLPTNPGLSWSIANVSPESVADKCIIDTSGMYLEFSCLFDQIAPLEEIAITITSPTTSDSCGTLGFPGSLVYSNGHGMKGNIATITINCPQSVYDNFDDNATDPSLWSVGQEGGPVAVETNQRLEITLPANSAGTKFDASYYGACLLRGDFDIQVDYELLTWPTTNGVRISLSTTYGNMERASFGSQGDFAGGPEVYLTDFAGLVKGITPTSDASGKLRVQRAGDTLTGFYLANGVWMTVASNSDPAYTADTSFALSSWSHDPVFADQEVKIAFDNMMINAGELVCPVADTTPPVITYDISGTLGTNGWYTSDVSLTWSVTDPESAINSTSGCEVVSITQDQAATDYTCSATSAGGTNSANVTIARDATKPVTTVTGVTEGATYILGTVPEWFRSTTDNLSGVATQATLVLSGGDAQGLGAITATWSGALDRAGNAADPVIIHYTVVPDTTPPVITPTVTGTLGANGWYTGDVSLTWDYSDPESGIHSLTGCRDESITQDQAATEYACAATSGGGTSSATVNIKRDATKPVTSVTNVVEGATYALGSVPQAGCSTTDNMSGVATEAILLLTGGDAQGLGNITATCSGALDAAGNTADHAVVHYTVNASNTYSFTGFFQPVDNPGEGPSYIFNRVKAGGAVPIRFSLGGDQGLSIFSSGYPVSRPVSCTTAAISDPIEETVTVGNSSLIYDPATDQYTYIWKTNKGWAGTCRVLTVQLDDGTQHLAYFLFK